MKAVFKLHYDCGRMGELTGLFVAEKEQIKWLIDSNLEVYFGEVLGKHSEIYGPLEEGDISIVTEEKSAIDLILDHDLSNGFNPLDYRLLNVEELLGDKYEDDLTASEAYEKLHS